ncbi:MAG: DUF5119 domain-containing protein [Bacteroides sp.]|nr:DUF5119 domain-containing protein [Bacteroides sp.]MCM1389253.1 DUF5119 domain-containing protein [Bacteroides sp.]
MFNPQYRIQAWLRNALLRAMLVVLSAVHASCDRRDDPARDTSAAYVDVDWSGYGKSVPAGMTVLFHHSVTGGKTVTASDDISRAVALLSPGRHWATVFSLTGEESGNIRFRGLDAVETAGVCAAEHDGSKWYAAHEGGGGYVALQPEWLAVDTIMTAAVAPGAGDVLTASAGTLRPRNVVYTLHVTVRVGNIGSLLAARGAISGLAAGRRFAAGSPDDNSVTVTHLIESGCWTRSLTSSGDGLVKAEARCFGLPADHGGTPGENRLEFQVLLADGETVMRYEIPVGHLIKQPAVIPGCRGDNLDLWLDVRLDDPLPPCGGAGGVDVWFDDWDDYVDFDMPI